MDQTRTAIVLVNLGTPDSPTENDIRRYLKQFLSDPRVVSLPRWLWLPILNFIILRTRPARLVEKYKMVWGRHDGPIRNITRALGRRLQSRLNTAKIYSAMTYGSPSIGKTLDEIRQQGFEKILYVPLFPQYAGATVGAVEDEIARTYVSRGITDSVKIIREYHRLPAYIEALADSIRGAKLYRDKKPLIVFSFHGIPQAQSDAGDPYAAQCQTTAKLVAQTLQLDQNQWMVTFQSRFGPAAWLKPYTDVTMQALPGSGVTDVLLVCPGFSVDCLETIEEIRILNKSIFLAAGGSQFAYVKALNASWRHVDVMQAIVDELVQQSEQQSEQQSLQAEPSGQEPGGQEPSGQVQ